MDVYTTAIDSTKITQNAVNADDVFVQIPEVSFEAGREFDLNFFDNAEDSNTLGGYSDPGSVESTSIESPPPSVASALLHNFTNSHGLADDCGNGRPNDGNTSFQLCQTASLNHIKCGMFLCNIYTFIYIYIY